MGDLIVSLIPTIQAFYARAAEVARTPRIAVLARAAGWAVLLAALTYLVLALREYDWALLGAALSQTAWALTIVCAVVYAAMLMVLAVGWRALADPAQMLRWRDIVVVYGLGVVAKYLPGSLFQYAARHVRGSQSGLAHGPMAKSNLFEGAAHIPAALLAGSALWLGGGFIALLALAFAAAAVLGLTTQPMVRAGACQVLFFSILALIAALVAHFGLGVGDPDRLAGGFMLAWVAGFLVPVAPGGVGVREAALLTLVATPEAAVLVGNFALLMRVVTTVGDGIMGLAAYGLVLGARENRQASA